MAWVRYDDQFPINGKVTAVIADDAGALALQVLANTWSNTTKHPGYIPPHQPGMLLADKALAAQWAAVLVRHGMFHERGSECPECKEEYAGLPEDKAAGWVIHNAKDYRPPARDRTTPGTPADLSEKRREAGRKGGRASAARRGTEGKQKPANEATQANGQANAEANPSKPGSKTGGGAKQNAESATSEEPAAGPGAGETPTSVAGFAGVSKTSNLLEQSVSPVPVPEPGLASNEARVSPTAHREATGDDEPPTFDGMPAKPIKPKRQPTNDDTAFGIARWWIAKRETDGAPVIVNSQRGPMHHVQKAVVAWLSAYSEDEIKKALETAGVGVPSAQQLERALKTVRGGPDWAAADRKTVRRPGQVHDTHAKTYVGLNKGRTA